MVSREEDAVEERQQREHAVRCIRHCGRMTWETSAVCLACRLEDKGLLP